MSNSSVSSDDNGNRRPGSYRKASAADLLDSNGETDDEEIEKLHKTIHDQTKALTEEKQNALKVILMNSVLFIVIRTGSVSIAAGRGSVSRNHST